MSPETSRPTESRATPASRTGLRLVLLALLGMAWGLGEVVGGETVVLVACGLFALSLARALVNAPGSSAAVAGIAMLLEGTSGSAHLCHLAGIALLGVAFDGMATLLLRHESDRLVRGVFVGVSTGYLSPFLFAASMVWVVQYRHWVDGGVDKVIEHTLSSGVLAALVGLVVVPAGILIGTAVRRRIENRAGAAQTLPGQ